MNPEETPSGGQAGPNAQLGANTSLRQQPHQQQQQQLSQQQQQQQKQLPQSTSVDLSGTPQYQPSLQGHHGQGPSTLNTAAVNAFGKIGNSTETNQPTGTGNQVVLGGLSSAYQPTQSQLGSEGPKGNLSVASSDVINVNTQATYHMQRMQRIKQLGHKRVKQESQIDTVQINLPSMQIPRQFTNTPPLTSLSDRSVSHQSTEFRRQYQANVQVQQAQYNQLINEHKNNTLDHMLEQLKVAERMQERFDRQAFEQLQTEQLDDVKQAIQFLQQGFSDHMKRQTAMYHEVYQKTQGVCMSTSKMFEYTHTQLFNDKEHRIQAQQQGNIKIKDLQQQVAQADEAIESILNIIESQQPQVSQPETEQKVANICQQFMSLMDQKFNQMNATINQIQNNYTDLKEEVYAIISKLQNDLQHIVTQFQVSLQQRDQRLENLEHNMLSMTKHVQNIDKMCQVSYFTSNVLADQDHVIKQGMQESSLKQSNMLDLMENTNKILQANLPSGMQRQQIDKQFKDSVRSLNLNRKVELNMPQVGKIQEFLQVDPNSMPSERYQTDQRAYDQNRKQYEDKVKDFFQAFPKDHHTFMQTNYVRTGEPTYQEQQVPQPPVQNIPEQTGTSNYKQETNFVNMPQKSLDEINQELERYRAQDNQGLNLGGLGATNGESVNNAPPINILKREQPHNQQPQYQNPLFSNVYQEPTFNYDQYMNQQQVPNPAHVVYGTAPEPKTYYHKFNFRQKYYRGTHPRVFVLQFETMADQYGLSDQQKLQQFMFTMEGEYFDWYKARCLQPNPLNWVQLKNDFFKTYSTPNEDAKDELLKLSQKHNESADQFLQRLRKTIETSDLTDDHVKNQFVNGLSSEIAKQYINNMKQFNREMYNQHTSTTLLHELNKRANLYKFNLNPARVNPSQPSKTTTTRYFKYPRRPISNNKPTTNYRPSSGNFNKSNTPKKVNTLEGVTKIKEEEPQQELPQDAQISQRDTNDLPQDAEYVYDPASDFKGNEFDEYAVEVTEDIEDQDVSNSMFVGDKVQTPPEFNQPIPQSQAGETTHLHNVFRKNQKSERTYAEKLVDLANKGKQLPYSNIQNIEQLQYISLPKQQLLQETPAQFINACKYIQGCLNSTNNILNTSQTTQFMQRFIDAINIRYQEVTPLLSNKEQDVQKPITFDDNNDDNNKDTQHVMSSMQEVNATLQTKVIDFLYYIHIKFENVQVWALVDTGSSATVVSEEFCKRNNITIPKCKYSRQVTVADGSTSLMREWPGARIKLDDYMSVLTDVLVSKGKTYDLLLGLNTCDALGATIQQDFFRYYVKINEKERFGKIPINKRSTK